MNSKAQEGGSLNILKIAVIVLIVMVVVIAIFVKYFGQEADIIGENICGVNHDEDGDGIPDIADKCPCDEGEPDECPTSATECQAKLRASCKHATQND